MSGLILETKEDKEKSDGGESNKSSSMEMLNKVKRNCEKKKE